MLRASTLQARQASNCLAGQLRQYPYRVARLTAVSALQIHDYGFRFQRLATRSGPPERSMPRAKIVRQGLRLHHGIMQSVLNFLIKTVLILVISILGLGLLLAYVLPLAARGEAWLRGQFEVECRDMNRSTLRSHIVHYLKEHERAAEIVSLQLVSEPRYSQTDHGVDWLTVAFDTDRAQQTAMVGCYGDVEISYR